MNQVGFRARAVDFMVTAISIGVGLGLAGCGGGSSSVTLANPNPPQVTRGQYGTIQYTLRSPKTLFAVGEQVPFVFTVTNTGAEPITYDRLAPLSDALIRTPTGGPIWAKITPPFGGGPGSITAYLLPGESLSEEFSWDQTSGNPEVPLFPRSLVSPGTYRITAFAHALYLPGVVDRGAQRAAAPMNIVIL